jgi:UDP-2,3-diacylglucosamine pyrophosphatase LpxH
LSAEKIQHALMVRTIVLSDLHFGSPTAIAAHPHVLSALEKAFADVDQIILLGDLFSLHDLPWPQVVQRAQPFLDLLSRAGKPVVYLPGNHDYHFVVMADDERRFGSDIERGDVAARILQDLVDVPVQGAYPFYTREGITFMHGHHTAPHVLETGVGLIDDIHLRHYRQGNPTRTLRPEEYDALMSPVNEMMYELAQAPSGPAADRYISRMKLWTLATMYATRSSSHTLAAGIGRKLQRRLQWKFPLKDRHTVVALLGAVCRDFSIAPGKVISGHTHQAYENVTLTHYPQWTFYNTGCWVYNKMLLDLFGEEAITRPGTALVVQDGEIQLHDLLAQYSSQELLQMRASENFA